MSAQAILGLPATERATAASNAYDFGYRFERALDPGKRGPATGDVRDSGAGA